MSALGRQIQRMAVRGSRSAMTQTLSEPMAWNQTPSVVTVLPNGVKVATKETFGEVASVGVFLNAGVRDETAETRGAGKVLEHLAYCGTAKRPKAKLEGEVESMGASLTASVGREQSAYTMSLFKGDLKQGVDILSDLVTAPGVAGFAKEKDTILRKFDDSSISTRELIDDRLHACAFRDCALGGSLHDSEEAALLTEEKLKSYVSSTVTADNLVLVGSGQVKHEELVKLATAAFGGLKASAPKMYDDKPYFCGAELIYRNDEMGPIAYCAVGWEGVPWKSADAVTFMVMKHIIGTYTKNKGLVPGNISGNRTINNVANKMNVGCADHFETFNYFYKDTGMFGFYIECDEVAVEHAVGELMFGANMMSFSVTEEEVSRAKRELKAALFSAPTSAEAACKELGAQVLGYGRSISAAELMLRIDAIDSEEVKRVGWKYLNDAEVSTTALGPLHGYPQYYDIRRMTYMHRY